MKPARPHMPLGVKLAACLITMGYHPADAARAAGIRLPAEPEGALAWSAAAMDERIRARIDFDHSPALALRRKLGTILVPSANDPRWISPIGRSLHAEKSKDDTTRAAKVKRLAARAAGELKPKRKRAWPKGRKIATRARKP